VSFLVDLRLYQKLINEDKFKAFYKKLCTAAFGINIGLIVFALLSDYYIMIPLAVINCLLLSFVYVIEE